MSTPLVTLNDGRTIPQLGFGVFKVDPGEAEGIVAAALEAGYRHIDTAAVYKNEAEVGRAIASSGIPRDELYITTKVWNDQQGTKTTHDAIRASLDRLGVESVNLYLVHWPAPARDLYVETWRALEEIRDSGLANSIGVSNFTIAHLERLLAETAVVPAVNQIELHPAFQQTGLTDFMASHGIAVQAWGPLGQGRYPLLDDPIVTDIAKAHGRAPAQVIIRWHLQQNRIVFPKSRTPARILENFEVFDFELTPEDLTAISSLERGLRVGADPEIQN